MATPLSNGASFGLEVKQATVTYADTTAAKLFDLPANSYLVDIKVDIQTAFSGGTTTIDIGKGGDADYFANDVDVSGSGRASASVLNGGISLGDRPLAVYATAAAGNTAGSVTVQFMYLCLSHSHLH